MQGGSAPSGPRLIFQCEVCPATAASAWAYVYHLDAAHPVGELARAVEPSLFGSVVINEASAAKPRVWDRWDQGGKSGRATRRPGP